MVLLSSYEGSKFGMKRLDYLVIAIATILSLGLGSQMGTTSLLPISQTAHAAVTDKISLSGCAVVRTPCSFVGWNGTVDAPNPTITVNQGDVASISLSSADGLMHEFLFDADNDGTADALDCPSTDPCSSPIPPDTTYVFTVPSVTPMTYIYFCTVHTFMKGSFTVLPGITVGGIATHIQHTQPLPASLPMILASVALLATALSAVYVTRKSNNADVE